MNTRRYDSGSSSIAPSMTRLQLAGIRLLFGVWRRGRGPAASADGVHGRIELPIVLPQARVGFVDHDARQPRRQLRARLELFQMREGVQICLLQNVFDLALVFHDRARRTVELLIVPAHHDFEQRVFAGKDSPHQLVVRQRGREGRGTQLSSMTD